MSKPVTLLCLLRLPFRRKAGREAYLFVISIHSKNVRPAQLAELSDSASESVSCLSFPLPGEAGCKGKQLFAIGKKNFSCFSLAFLSCYPLLVKRAAKVRSGF
ncbi:hypothetical protein [Hymenobacter sp. APR13]|uniref:hypothetical protein n=1 Tax=Hymenobacter sp. APR13 TaxID=1356852 RepID=UPI0012E02D35|nr:hypothetical protein [Hymenobacter sp. APR13]